MNGELFTFGASVRGPGHKRAGLPNQDAHLSFIKDGCGGIVLSDGLGSCIQSDKGSKAACCAVVSAMEHALTLMSFDIDVFLEEVKSIYCSSIDIDEYSDYLATCLWCFCPGDGRVYAGMLGDGMVALIDRKGVIVRLTDAKSDGFSNVVSSLSPNTRIDQGQTISLPEDEFVCVVLCSDGVSDDLLDINGFVKEFVAEYQYKDEPNDDIADMLENWPVPLHSDDKTIICMVRRR